VSGHDIFISYSREERPAARHFAESLAQEGFTVWWDAVLRSGQTFDEVIEKELRAAKAVVVLWSRRSVASRWVRAEATLADRSDKLVPVIIEACDRPIIFELTHAADLADWTGDTSDPRWQTLISDLRRLVGGDIDDSDPPASFADRAQAEKESRRVVEDRLVQAIEHLDQVPGSGLSPPATGEADHTQFFRRSDAYHLNEGDKVHLLQRLDGEDNETRYVVNPGGLKIGRSAPADIIVTGSGVSRAHCLIELSGSKIRVSDLNSTNGTYIDNKRIDRPENLAVGSVLRVGNVSFEHEVRSRADPSWQVDPASVGEVKPAARLARSS